MGSRQARGSRRVSPLVCAAALFCLLVVPIAAAGTAGDAPQATASASVKKQVKKLKKQLKALNQEMAAVQQSLAELEGRADLPSGAAGGDLAGSYPNPSIRGGAVNSAKVADDSLTGADVNEGALGATPLATRVAQGGCQPAVTGTGQMVKAGPACIDRYEASVWSRPNGGVQYGVNSDNYPCADNGQNCNAVIFARSVPGVTPSRFITWFQAQQALANSGKRLPTSAEWQMAVVGTPESTACNVGPGGSIANTGSRAGCTSNRGAVDMVGNVWEWVADWVPASTGCPGWGSFSNDYMCLSGASTTTQGPGALIRGSSWNDTSAAGPFSVSGSNRPWNSVNDIGFRGAR